MKAQRSKPWLNSTGIEIPTSELREISRSWSPEEWEEYLKWYETPQHEKLISSELYDDLGETDSSGPFAKFNQNGDEESRAVCEGLLRSLPAREAQVLRLSFYDGRTVREISAIQGIPKSSVHDIKNRALSRLRSGERDGISDTGHPMRGEGSIWMRASSSFIKEAQVYDPSQQKEAFEEIQHHSLKVALRELSERQLRIIYLRFWCDYSAAEIARDLRCGVNLIDQLLEASIARLKRKILDVESEYSSNGGPSCA